MAILLNIKGIAIVILMFFINFVLPTSKNKKHQNYGKGNL